MSNPVLDEAVALLEIGQREQALKLLVNNVKQHPNEAIAWYNLALVVEEPGQKIDCLERAVKINPDLSEAVSQLAHLKTQYQTNTSAAEIKDTRQNMEENPLFSISVEQTLNSLHEREPAEIFHSGNEPPVISAIELKPVSQPGEPARTAAETPFKENSLSENEVTSPAVSPFVETSIFDNEISEPETRKVGFFAQLNKVDRFIFCFILFLLFLCLPITLLLAYRIFGGTYFTPIEWIKSFI